MESSGSVIAAEGSDRWAYLITGNIPIAILKRFHVQILCGVLSDIFCDYLMKIGMDYKNI